MSAHSESFASLGEIARPKVTAALFYVDEAFLRRNSIEQKLAKVGVTTKKLIHASSARTADLTTVDVVLFIEGAMTDGTRDALVSRAVASGRVAFALSHRTSHQSWMNLASYVARRSNTIEEPRTVTRSIPAPAPANELPPTPPVSATLPKAPAVPKTIAERVAETEQLAEIYEKENADLKEENAKQAKEIAELHAMVGQKSEWKVERERMIENHAQALAERTVAVRKLDEMTREMTARLEASERERAQEENRAKRLEDETASANEHLIAARAEVARLEAEKHSIASRLGGVQGAKNETERTIARLRADLDEANRALAAKGSIIDAPKFNALVGAWRVGALSAEEVLAKLGAQ